jgi:hypothetical protein
MRTEFWSSNLTGRERVEDLSENDRLLFECILEN